MAARQLSLTMRTPSPSMRSVRDRWATHVAGWCRTSIATVVGASTVRPDAGTPRVRDGRDVAGTGSSQPVGSRTGSSETRPGYGDPVDLRHHTAVKCAE